MNYHLAILKTKYLNAILSGEKTIESRFMKAPVAPFGRVAPGDVIFLKTSGGNIRAVARVSKVASFDNLNSQLIAVISDKYNSGILGDDAYWNDVSLNCVCGFLAWLDDVKRLPPAKISKKDMRAWVILTEQKNFGLFDKYESHLKMFINQSI